MLRPGYSSQGYINQPALMRRRAFTKCFVEHANDVYQLGSFGFIHA